MRQPYARSPALAQSRFNPDVAEALIIDALRTPMGRYRGALSRIRPDDLAAHVVRAAVERNGIEGQRIGDVLLFPRGNLQLVATVIGHDGTPMNAPQFRGLHGGLTEDEALVPLLAVRV